MEVQPLPQGVIVVPVYTDERAKLLLDDYVTQVESNGETIDTAPYRFSMAMYLMSLTSTDALLANGVLDRSDSISVTGTGLSAVYLQVNDSVQRAELMWDQHLLQPESQDNYRNIKYKGIVELRTPEGVQATVTVTIVIDTETTLIEGYANMTPPIEGIRPVGYDLHLERVNLNRRPIEA